MMVEKRFNVVKSNIVENAWFIKDELKIFTFPAIKGDSKTLFTYCKALNNLMTIINFQMMKISIKNLKITILN